MYESNWMSVLPPLLAIILAIVTRQVIISLGIGIALGYCILGSVNPFTGIAQAIDGVINVFSDSEDAKVSIRTHRRSGIDEISKLKDDHSADEIKRLETQVQDITDNFVNKIDELLTVKQNELLEV